jgi:hypothetical protein
MNRHCQNGLLALRGGERLFALGFPFGEVLCPAPADFGRLVLFLAAEVLFQFKVEFMSRSIFSEPRATFMKATPQWHRFAYGRQSFSPRILIRSREFFDML